MGDRLPNFLHLGPGKSGSTWLHEALILHPDAYLTPAKDLYFFSRYYDRGISWYRQQFQAATSDHHIVGEICPDYLVCPQAAERIHDSLGAGTHLMVTLREPVSRAFSSYLYLKKHGLADPTFRDTLARNREIVEEGRYTTQLTRYLRYFKHDQIQIAIFDDLQADPQAFLDSTTDWLGLTRYSLPSELLGARLPASKARWPSAARLAQMAARVVREHDGAELVGRVKRSPFVQRSLYKPLGDDAPVLASSDADFVRDLLESEIAGVESEFGIQLRVRWGW